MPPRPEANAPTSDTYGYPPSPLARLFSSCARVPIVALVSLLLGTPLSIVSAEETNPPTAQALIEALELEGHIEGGFSRRTYEATEQARIATPNGDRFRMTSIYYLLTADGPIGHFHRNTSDIVHYFHLGDPIEYFLIHPDGTLETVVMGPDPTRGQRLQLTVPGGIWKASKVSGGSHGYGLISEAVSPGFDYADMTLGMTSQLLEEFPQHEVLIRQLSRETVTER